MKPFCTLLLAVFAFFPSTFLQAQFTLDAIAKPYGGGDVSALGAIGNTLVYASGGSQFYLSTDQGLQWTKVPYSLNTGGTPVKAIGLDGKLYVVGYGNTFHSSDLGASWQQVNGAPNGYSRQLIALPSGVLIGTFNHELFRSEDSGASWDTVLTNINSYRSEFVFDAATGRVYYCAEGNQKAQIFASDDSGKSWQVVFTGDDIIRAPALAILPDGTLLAGGREDGKVWRSTDHGLNWTGIQVMFGNSKDFPAESFAVTGSGRIFCIFWYITFYSDNNGLNWQEVAAPWGKEFNDYYYLPGAGLFAQLGSMYRSTDDGASWEFAATGIRNATVNDLAVLDDERFFATTYDGLFHTYDAGANWAAVYYFGPQRTYDVEFDIKTSPDGTFYLSSADTLLRSTDGGQSWLGIETPAGHDYYLENFGVNPVSGVLYVGGYPDLYISYDKGSTWILRPNAGLLSLREIQFAPDGTAYGYSNYKYITVRSNDEFVSWDTIRVPGADDWAKIRVGAGGFLTAYYYPKLYRSFDNGASWDSVRTVINYTYGPGFNNLNYIFGEVGDWTLRYSVDYGLSWQPLYDHNWYYYFFTNPKFRFSPSQRLYIFDGYYFFRTAESTASLSLLGGTVFSDDDKNCAPGPTENPRHSFTVRAEKAGTEYFGTSNSSGIFRLPIENGNWNIQPLVPNPLWASCSKPLSIQTANTPGLIDSIDLGVQVLEYCPYMEVSLGAFSLRRCFPGQYVIDYCNRGTVDAPNAYVVLQLDPFLIPQSASLPYTQNGPLLRFDLGTVASQQCGEIRLNLTVSCDAALGQVHCSSVHIYPDTVCTSNWKGSELRLQASCQGDKVQFVIYNDDASMTAPVEYSWNSSTSAGVTYGNFQLVAGQSLAIAVPAPSDGGYVYFRHGLEPGYPFGTFRSASVIGCPGPHPIVSIGGDVLEPYLAQHCVSNIGAFDPNDKQGFPPGILADHHIEPDQQLRYLIRFQNTGTDTAFNVVLRDTLSPYLDLTTLRVGASSHPGQMELNGRSELSFYFPNIYLPDSTINEPASHGFVEYTVSARADAPKGSRIENRAGIYFDFNAPVLTNTTWYTLGMPFKVVSLQNPAPAVQVLAWPNPFRDALYFTLQTVGPLQSKLRLELVDVFGRIVFSETVLQWPYHCTPGPLPAGAYLVRCLDTAGRVLAAGKLQKLP